LDDTPPVQFTLAMLGTSVRRHRGADRMRKLSILLCALLFSDASWALCLGGHPSVTVGQEVQEAKFVIIGRPTKLFYVRDIVENPDGYEATLIQVKVDKILYGRAPTYAARSFITLYNVNTSARFPMDEKDYGKPFVLFVNEGPDGYWVSSCGHSDELKRNKHLLVQIEKLWRGVRKGR
jgi:hypothetical protein